MSRTLLLAGLVAAYLTAGLWGRIGELLTPNRFDPFLPLARSVELRVGERRFAEARPLADSLARAYPDQPLVAFWRARIQHGLGNASGEALAWEDYIRMSSAPAEACPAIAEAYAAAGRTADALRGYERCAAFTPDDSDRIVDLGDAYARARQRADARQAYARALQHDGDNPALLARVAALGDPR